MFTRAWTRYREQQHQSQNHTAQIQLDTTNERGRSEDTLTSIPIYDREMSPEPLPDVDWSAVFSSTRPPNVLAADLINVEVSLNSMNLQFYANVESARSASHKWLTFFFCPVLISSCAPIVHQS